MDRSLAHVELISNLSPIPEYDRVELATILGWQVVVRKDEFNIGDKCVYFEIDSLLPEEDWSEFLRPKHFKVKTQKMCKTISQGLALPLSTFPTVSPNAAVGTDLTETLKVKYYVPEDNVRKASSPNPNAKYNSMAQRYPRLFKTKPFRFLMKRLWGRKLLFIFFGRKKDKPKGFPTKFDFVHRTDETRCLIGNTKIDTEIGPLRIADIVNKHLDVKIKSVNKNNEIELKKIKGYQRYDIDPNMIEIVYPGKLFTHKLNRIKCTLDHRFMTQRGYVKAQDLTLNDTLFTRSVCYDPEIIPFIYGALLGDAGINFDKRGLKPKDQMMNSPRVSFCQGEAQLPYLEFKKQLFGGENINIRCGKSGYQPNNKVYNFYIKVDDMISNALYSDGVFETGKFMLTQSYIDRLTPLSLAIWYMDDGTLRHADDGLSPSIELSTNSFSYEENQLLVDMLRNKYGIECSLYKSPSRGYYSIRLLVKSTVDFLNLVTKYIHPTMRYKTLPGLRDTEFVLNNFSYVKKDQVLPCKILELNPYSYIKSPYANKPQSVYDIEVEDNHNFFANGILTHNCENIPTILEDKRLWIQTLKIDGTSSTYILERIPPKFPFQKPKYEYYVCSRNVRQLDPKQACFHDENVYWAMNDKYHIREFLQDQLEKHPEYSYVCLQGETAGVGVQGNPHKLPDTQFFGFNYITSTNGRWNSVDAANLCSHYNIPWVPIISIVYTLPDTMEELKLQADGPCELPGSSGLREGYVYRSYGGETSFKNVSRKYLLKHDL